jgi:hypothetical protein
VAVLIDLDAASPVPRRRRGLLKPASLAAMLLLLGGAATPASADGIVRVADTGDSLVTTHLLTPTALYTANASTVTAIPLAPGGSGWTAPAPDEQVTLSISGATLAVLPQDDGAAVFLDARTGKVRWRAPQFATIRLFGSRVAVWTWIDGRDTGLLRMADIATGRTLWARSDGAMALAGDERRVITIDAYGRSMVLASPTGAKLAAREDADLIDQGDGTVVLGDRLYWWTSALVAAYALPSLTPLWRVRARATERVAPCGPLICLTGGAGVTAVDPAGGKVRWTSAEWRSIAGDVAVTRASRAARLDPATGRVVEELGRGGPVGGLMLRFDHDRTWAIRLRDGRVLGALPLVLPSSCAAAGAYLACPTADRNLTVWAAA